MGAKKRTLKHQAFRKKQKQRTIQMLGAEVQKQKTFEEKQKTFEESKKTLGREAQKQKSFEEKQKKTKQPKKPKIQTIGVAPPPPQGSESLVFLVF